MTLTATVTLAPRSCQVRPPAQASLQPYRAEGLFQGEPARIERLADDRRVHPERQEGRDCLQVGALGDAAAGDARALRSRAYLPQQVKVRPGQRAVPSHVADHEPATPCPPQPR